MSGRALAAAALAGLAAPLAAPLAAQSAQGDVALTIYNGGLALVEDVRPLDIPAGRVRLEFPDVSAQIRAETVSFAAAGTAIVEQNFDYDLLSPAKLMEKAVGKTVTLVRTNPATGAETREQAKVLAANEGVIVQIGSRIEVLRDDSLPVRVVFDQVPANLRARPTLSVTVASDRAGVRPATLAYLTPGLGWRADYVALFDEAGGRIDMQGWVTLSNTTGTTFENARLLMVAGRPAGGGRGGFGVSIQPGVESGTRERLGDYYLYPLRDRTTVADAQTKQISFLDVQGAAARSVYQARIGWLETIDTARGADTVLQFANSRAAGLGDQLPEGIVRVYLRDRRGTPQFIGEARIPHTPMGSKIDLRTGEAFDVKVRAVVEKRQRLGDDRWRTSMRYTLSNARGDPVTVELRQQGLDRFVADTRIVEESQPGARVSSDAIEWQVAVPANGESIVTATFDTRF